MRRTLAVMIARLVGLQSAAKAGASPGSSDG
jgi:hypothetical protein